MADKQCSRCGKTFGCGNEAPGCWCENYSLSSETLARLRKDYANCLCETCLAAFEEKTSEKEV